MTRDEWRNYICCVLTVREELIRDNRPLVQDLVNHVQAAGSWLDAGAANRDKAVQIAAGRKFFNQDPKILRFVMENPTDRVTYGDLRMIRAEFEELMQLSIEAGTLKRPVAYERYVDESFVKNLQACRRSRSDTAHDQVPRLPLIAVPARLPRRRRADRRPQGRRVRAAARGAARSPCAAPTAARFDLASYRGKVVVLEFGFTHCPDVCPVSLASLAQARKLLGADAAEVQVVFVTVDPARDSVARLRDYLAASIPASSAAAAARSRSTRCSRPTAFRPPRKWSKAAAPTTPCTTRPTCISSTARHAARADAVRPPGRRLRARRPTAAAQLDGR